MQANTKLRMGLIGAGRIGKLHAENLASRISGAQLVGVADVQLAAAQEVAKRHGVATAVADYRDLLEDPQVEAVAVCSATDTHAQIVQDAALAGKQIFCEKPIDIDLERIDLTLEAVEKAGVKFQVGFNRRFDSNFSKAREMVASGKIGKPHLLRITSRDPEPPPVEYIKASGGIFLDMTIHDFDIARYLLGTEVTEIYAVGVVLVDQAIEEAGDIDTAVITMQFENGAIGTIDNSRRAVYGYDQRVEVFGSEGMVAVSNKTPDTLVYSDGQGLHSAKPLYFFLERYYESYLAEMREFVEAVLNDIQPPVLGSDGRQAVVIGLAAKKSLDENRPVLLREME